jgi:hypothetical protein
MEDPGLDGRIILRWIFRNWDVRAWTESSSDREMLRGRVIVGMNCRVA